MYYFTPVSGIYLYPEFGCQNQCQNFQKLVPLLELVEVEFEKLSLGHTLGSVISFVSEQYCPGGAIRSKTWGKFW